MINISKDTKLKDKKVSDISLFFCKITLELCELLPKNLQKEFMKNSYISGGCIYGFINDIEYDDYDFFLKNKFIADKIKNHFVDEFVELHKIDVFIDKSKTIKKYFYNEVEYIITDNAITIKKDNKKYQIIYKLCGLPDYVVRKFDFIHCMLVYNYGTLQYCEGYIFDVESNVIIYNEETDKRIEDSFIRMLKYIRRGMIINNLSLLYMLRKVNIDYFNKTEVVRKFLSNETEY